jgi:Mg/Co/Ni transporter MgtE
MPGKADWLARGLPSEGEKATERRAAQVVRDDVATCRLEERIGDVRPRVEGSPYGFGLVVSEGGTLLGRLRAAALESDQARAVEEVMEPGPSTVRADTSPEKLRERLDKRDLSTAVVTTPDGVLLGVVRRADLD